MLYSKASYEGSSSGVERTGYERGRESVYRVV